MTWKKISTHFQGAANYFKQAITITEDNVIKTVNKIKLSSSKENDKNFS